MTTWRPSACSRDLAEVQITLRSLNVLVEENMPQIEYYNTKPVDPSQVEAILRGVMDGLVGQILGIDNGSATIQILFKYFGPSDTTNDLNKLISRDGEFVYLDGAKL